ncbi:MAG: cobalt/nickel transport system permease protein, partial [Halothiobacillaceae bacterium]
MALDIDRFAHLESLLQRWDPRTKILSLMLFIVAVALLHSIALATCALLIALGLLRITRIPRAFVASGVTWVLLFLLPFLLIMPATYPGEPDTHLLGIPFAWPGFRLAILIVIKA